LKDSSYFRVEFYAVDGDYEYLTATDNSSVKVHGLQLAAGNISGIEV
jgi:hypothetical protein